MKRVRTRSWIAGLLLGVAVGLAGCQDAGTGVDEQIPTGVVVLDSNGNTVASATTTVVTGRITVPNGQQRTFEVRLIGIGGSEIGLGGRYSLQPRVLTGQHASAAVSGSDRLVVTGRLSGSTTLILDVMDGGTSVLGPLIPMTIS
ncbi:MAG TPA: hypothetical protein VF615_19915 [Longimicrobiaceae bacterium]|jgi:hypothetical protein